MSSCVSKILLKSEQICGCCCKMLRGSLFWGHTVKCGRPAVHTAAGDLKCRIMKIFKISTHAFSTTSSFYHAMICMRGICYGPCLSVCLSQVGVLLKRLNVGSHKQHHMVAQLILVFWCQRSPRNSTGVTSYGGTQCRWVGQNRRLSTNNWLYLENGNIVSIKVE